jgi:hypothetical protein
MASTGFIVDMDNSGNGGRQLRFDAPILCCSAPFSGSRSFEPRDSPKT